MLSPGEWGRRTSRVIQGPFTWLCWAGEGPVAGCTTTKSRCYLLWASLCSQTEGDDFWSHALLLSVCSEIMGEQDATGGCVRLSSRGGEGRIFTYRWAYPIHGVWNWGVSFWSAARVLSCKRSALEAILHLGLRDTYLGFRDFGCKRENCMWVNPSSHVTVRAIKGFVLYVSKDHLQVSIPVPDWVLTSRLWGLTRTSPHPHVRENHIWQPSTSPSSHGMHWKFLRNMSYTYPLFKIDTLLSFTHSGVALLYLWLGSKRRTEKKTLF